MIYLKTLRKIGNRHRCFDGKIITNRLEIIEAKEHCGRNKATKLGTGMGRSRVECLDDLRNELEIERNRYDMAIHLVDTEIAKYWSDKRLQSEKGVK